MKTSILDVENCNIINNLTDVGGGIFVVESLIKVNKCNFSDNSARRTEQSIGRGGGIYLEVSSGSSISNCQFINNKAFLGGGISCLESSITINGCLIKNNEAEWGGGLQTMFMGYQTINIWDCIIEKNSAKALSEFSGIGGGFMLSGGVNEIGTCKFIGNYATSEGGGIYSNGSDNLTLGTCVIIDNSTDGVGGGIYFYEDRSSNPLYNCLIANNKAQTGGAVYCDSNSIRTFLNNTITGNSNPGIYISEGSSTSFKNCIVWNNNITGTSEISYSDVEGRGYDENGNIDADPLFVSGPWGDYYLSNEKAGQNKTSPCVDAADPHSRFIFGVNRTDGVYCSFDKLDMGCYYPFHVEFDLHKIPDERILKTGDTVDILFDIKSAPKPIKADIYFILDYNSWSACWSGLSWLPGIKPALSDFTIPENLAIENALLVTFSIPSNKPPVRKPGLYTFWIVAAKPGTGGYISCVWSCQFNIE